MLKFIGTCVNWPPHDVNASCGLCDMVDAEREITRRTFLKHVPVDELRAVEVNLGYEEHPSRGLTMSGDAHVRYYKSRLHGKTVYYFVWSAIEHVFG